MYNMSNANNLHVLRTNQDSIPSVSGKITGFVYTGKLYYTIIDKALHVFGNERPVIVPLSPHPLLDTIAYYCNVADDRVFVTDGHNFYFEHTGTKKCDLIPCPTKIVACAYSPMQDKLVYLDVNNRVVLCDIFPKTQAILTEATWSLSDVPPAQLNVNWGAASTQFAGFDNTTRIDLIINAVGIPCTDETPEIVWRPDGKYFLISHTIDSVRHIKIFSIAEGAVANIEQISGLLSPITWQPIEHTIAVACCSNDAWKIIIYEPNGRAKLVHIMNNNLPIIQLKWSKDGKILAVLEDGGASSNVLLYTITGYCFDLKQSLQYKVEVRYIEWLELTGSVHHLTVVLNDTVIHYYLRMGPTLSSLNVDEGTMTAIINGPDVVLVDTLKNVGTTSNPEPNRIISFPNAISQVVFNATQPMALAIDSGNMFRIFSYNRDFTSDVCDHIGFSLPIQSLYPLHVHHIVFWEHFLIVYMNDNANNKELFFDLINKTCANVSPARADVTGVKLLKTFPDKIQKYTFYSNGDLYLDLVLIRNYKNLIIKMESFCYQNNNYLLVLDNANRFFCDNILVASDVTSFLTFYGYVLFTRTNNNLYGCRHNIFLDCIRVNKQWDVCDFRSIPIGGVLVAPVPLKLHALIQDTVGAVEIVSIGLLSVDYVGNLLNNGLWNEVHAEIKLRHLNLNLLTDINMPKFIDNISAFIDSTSKQYLQDFVLQLTEGNILNAMNCKYQFLNTSQNSNKMSKICSAIVDYLKGKDLETYFEIILVTMIKWKGLSGGIYYAQEIYTKGESELNKIVERGLKLVCTLWNADDVLTECLKTYDLDFALFSHFIHKRDPAATATLIDTFYDSESESELRYKVNHYVGDYQEAVKYLALHLLDTVQSDANKMIFDQVIDYAVRYDALEVLYEHLKKQSVTVPRLCLELALVCEEKDQKERAAQLYVEACDLEAAFAAYACMFKWLDAINVINAMNINDAARSERLRRFADHLSAAGHHNGAKHIHLMQENYQDAIKEAVFQRSYIEAQDLIKKHDPSMTSFLRMEVLNYISTIRDTLANAKDNLECYVNRIGEIRNRRRIGANLNVGNVHPPTDDGEFDESHDGAESIGTNFSSIQTQSSNTSRKSKKEQKKYIDVKQGGLYEDIAIMRTMHLKITQISNLKKDVHDVVEVMADTPEARYCDLLLKHYNAMHQYVQEIIPQIWIENLNDMDIVNEELLAARTNIIFLEYQYRLRPEFTLP